MQDILSSKREEICRRCRMLPSIKHLEYPACSQQIGPVNEEERRLFDYNQKDRVTREEVIRRARITMLPYCFEKMLAGGFFDQF